MFRALCCLLIELQVKTLNPTFCPETLYARQVVSSDKMCTNSQDEGKANFRAAKI